MNDHASLISRGFVLGPNGYYRPDKAVAARPCTSLPERDAGRGPLGTGEAQKKGSGRRLLRITCYRTRLLDPDNNIAKWEVDALRYAGIIEEDSADHVEILTKQVKVKSKTEVGTLIEIEEIP